MDGESADYLIDVQLDATDGDAARAELFERAAAATLAAEGQRRGELSIVVTDDATIRTLNRTYAGLDEATDVLSFRAQEGSGFVAAPDTEAYLGDIIIALPYASRQAARAGHALADELTLLTVHGVLHLLGYDHATADEQVRMWARQDAILDQLRQSAQGSGGH